jgi:hypothetical protein
VFFWLVYSQHRLSLRSFLIMSYTVYVTETNTTAVFFDTKEEAEEWIQQPDYDLCHGWECVDSKFDLVEDND